MEISDFRYIAKNACCPPSSGSPVFLIWYFLNKQVRRNGISQSFRLVLSRIGTYRIALDYRSVSLTTSQPQYAPLYLVIPVLGVHENTRSTSEKKKTIRHCHSRLPDEGGILKPSKTQTIRNITRIYMCQILQLNHREITHHWFVFYYAPGEVCCGSLSLSCTPASEYIK